jgi:hypothetical protein
LRLFDGEELYRLGREARWEHRESMYFAASILLPRGKFLTLAAQLLENA